MRFLLLISLCIMTSVVCSDDALDCFAALAMTAKVDCFAALAMTAKVDCFAALAMTTSPFR
jgi:hypothetical protein